MLIALSWPLALAVSQLVAGWIAGAALGMAMIGLQGWKSSTASEAPKAASPRPAGKHRLRIHPKLVFQLAAAVLVILTISTLVGRLGAVLGGIRPEIAWGCLILAGMGILKLGFNASPFPITIGLLTFLSGFIILYASLETSTAVAGLLAVIVLGLAIAGAYLVNVPAMEEEE